MSSMMPGSNPRSPQPALAAVPRAGAPAQLGMPQSVPLNIYRGDSEHWKFTLYTDVAQTLPYDLAGASAEAEIRDKSGGAIKGTMVCTITQPNVIDVDLTATESDKLTGAAVWDLQLTWPDGKVKTIVKGPVMITEDVTDSTRP